MVEMTGTPEDIRARDLRDFAGLAQAVVDSGYVRALNPPASWDALSEVAQHWTAALIREALAQRAVRQAEEIGFWHRDLAARILFDTAHHEAAVTAGRLDDAADIALRLRAAVASYYSAQAGEWHRLCDMCGEPELPGQATAAAEDVSGHARCLIDDRDFEDGPDPTEQDLAERVAAARRTLYDSRLLDVWVDEPEKRPTMPGPDANAIAAQQLWSMGWTYSEGAAAWRPPLGPEPDFLAQSERHTIADWLMRCGHSTADAEQSGRFIKAAEAVESTARLHDELRDMRRQRMGFERERELLDANNRLLARARRADAKTQAALVELATMAVKLHDYSRARFVDVSGEVRPLMVDCPQCNGEGFAADGGDRHAELRTDRCPTCKGHRRIPAGTGLTPGASAPPSEVA